MMSINLINFAKEDAIPYDMGSIQGQTTQSEKNMAKIIAITYIAVTTFIATQ